MSDRMIPLTHDEVVEIGGLYVLGALTDDEAATVRAHIAACPLAHPELDELGAVVPALLEDVEPIEPPAALRERILAAAANDLPAAAATAQGSPAQGALTATPPVSTVVDAAARFRPGLLSRSVDWAFRIAAAVAVVALLGWNLLLQGRLDDAEAGRAAFAAVVELAAQEGSLQAVLSGELGSGLAAVAPDGTTRIAVADLAPTTGDEVYTVWAISGEGAAPTPIGEFRVGGGRSGALSTTVADPAAGVTLALTLEPRTGAQTPTLPIVAAGTAS